ncbi:MAG: hypothetical protein QMC38_12705 [Sinobacterium sp.]
MGIGIPTSLLDTHQSKVDEKSVTASDLDATNQFIVYKELEMTRGVSVVGYLYQKVFTLRSKQVQKSA